MRKCVLLLVVLLLFTLCVPALAAENRSYSANPTLSFLEGPTAECYVNCIGDSTSDRIGVILTLYHDGEEVDSWHASGRFRVPLVGTCEVESGETYVLELTWYVNSVEQPSVSVSGTCP